MKNYLLFFTFLLKFSVNAQPGSLDNTFGSGGLATTDLGNWDVSTSVAIQSDGKIVVVGYSGGYTTNRDFSLIRYNSNGTLDSAFGSSGKVTTVVGGGDGAYSVAIQSDDKIVVAGNNHIGGIVDFVLVRYNNDGSLDSIFDHDGMVTTDFDSTFDYCYSVAIQSDGKILATGVSSTGGSDNHFALARYNNNGSLDNTFDSDGKVTEDFGGFNSIGNSVATQSDGKIVVAGYCYNGSNSDFALVRYNNNGSLDNTFDLDGKITSDFASTHDFGKSVATQSDGKIVVAGYSVSAGLEDFALVRYNNDGTLDNSFGSTGKVTTDFGSPEERGSSVAIQSDGKIVVAGKGEGDLAGNGSLARYNNDGSLDNTFDTDGKVTSHFGGFGSLGNSVAIQEDGKIVFVGYSDISSVDFAVVRYNGGTVGIEENSELNDITIYPNPSSGIFTFSLKTKTGVAKICVYDLLGNCLLNKVYQNDVSPKIDLSSQSKGIYFMEIRSNDERVVKKIVLQ